LIDQSAHVEIYFAAITTPKLPHPKGA